MVWSQIGGVHGSIQFAVVSGLQIIGQYRCTNKTIPLNSPKPLFQHFARLRHSAAEPKGSWVFQGLWSVCAGPEFLAIDPRLQWRRLWAAQPAVDEHVRLLQDNIQPDILLCCGRLHYTSPLHMPLCNRLARQGEQRDCMHLQLQLRAVRDVSGANCFDRQGRQRQLWAVLKIC